MNKKVKNTQIKPDSDTQPAERRHGRERRFRKDVSYQYEITLDPKPERRDTKERRKT